MEFLRVWTGLVTFDVVSTNAVSEFGPEANLGTVFGARLGEGDRELVEHFEGVGVPQKRKEK